MSIEQVRAVQVSTNVYKPKKKLNKKKQLSMYEAFELMHKQDGTSKGRRSDEQN